MDKKQFLVLMKTAAAIYDKKLTDELLDIYYSLLTKDGSTPAHALTHAFRMHFERSTSFPLPTEILSTLEIL